MITKREIFFDSTAAKSPVSKEIRLKLSDFGFRPDYLDSDPDIVISATSLVQAFHSGLAQDEEHWLQENNDPIDGDDSGDFEDKLA